MDNIEEFDLVAGEVFGICYKAFPKAAAIIDTDIVDLLKEASGSEHDPYELRLSDPEYDVVESTLTWLIRAGYLWEEESKSSFKHVRLSPMGLELMKLTPESLAQRESIGGLLSKGCKSLGKEVFVATVNAALGAAVSSYAGA